MIDLCVGTLIMSAIPVSSAAGNASGHDVDAAYFNYPAYEGNDLELDIADGTARFRLCRRRRRKSGCGFMLTHAEGIRYRKYQ